MSPESLIHWSVVTIPMYTIGFCMRDPKVLFMYKLLSLLQENKCAALKNMNIAI